MQNHRYKHVPLAFCIVASALASGCGADGVGYEDLGNQQQRAIFGADDRVEFAAVSDPDVVQWGNATAAMFDAGNVTCSSGNCSLSLSPLTDRPIDDGTWLPLCPGEPHLGQLAGAGCTAFLVAPDLVATAGHCVEASGCSDKRFVFGFEADANGNNVTQSVPESDVYSCQGIVHRRYSSLFGFDWAILELDRDVAGRTPLKIRRIGKVKDDAPLAVLGHPNGLPLKYADDGEVRSNGGTHKFFSSLDTFGGNSGSPVINTDNGVVEGIHVSRPSADHYEQSVDASGNSCATEVHCDENDGCPRGWFGTAWAGEQRITATADDVSCQTTADCTTPDQASCVTAQCNGNSCDFDYSACACEVDDDCDSPRLADCVQPVCNENAFTCEFDFSACECETSADCDDGIACTQDICFVSTRSCIHIDSSCD